MAKIYIDSSVLYITVFVCFALSYVLMYEEKEETKEPESEPTIVRQIIAQDAQRREDIDRIVHPLVPPVRRGPFSYSGDAGISVPVLTPTRGEYGSYQQTGYLFNPQDPDKAMPLMGRRIHSNQYEYYTFHHNNPQIKIPITHKKELNDGETINVHGYATPFNVKIYELDGPRYIPY